jgi:hypothetical protein
VTDAVDTLQDFMALLKRFLNLRSRPDCTNDKNDRIHPSIKLRVLESKWPESYASLRNIVLFTRRGADNLNDSGDYPLMFCWRVCV